METGFLVDPVDAGAQPHEEAGQLGEAGRVALYEEREGDQLAFRRDFEIEVLGQHFAARDELLRDEVGHRVPGHGGVLRVPERLFVLDADGDQGADVEWIFESDGAEVAKVGEAELVEVLVCEHAVVDEVEFDAALDGGYAAVQVDEADVGVGCEDGGQSGVHGVADRCAEVFDGFVVVFYGFPRRGEVGC